ncbi:MAG: extracellular solute-binding protein [Candidatus Latescibacteria bacterium]|nr:extracellular solute-binding protein [Candidatus Latescibacterota bacterium]
MPTLRVIYREFIGFEHALAKQAEYFRQRHPDVTLEFTHSDVPPLYETMIAKNGVFTDQYDVFLCLTDWLPELMKSGGLTRLNDDLAQDPPDGWPDGWTDSMTRLQRDRAGNIYGLPYHDGPEMFMYRTDLFDDPHEQEAFRKQTGVPLRPPETWSQFLDIATFFTRPDDGLYGCLVAAYPDGHNTVYDFMIHLWSRGGQMLDARMRPVFNQAEGVEGLQFYVDLINVHRVVPPEVFEFESVKSGHYYAGGGSAMMWNWCGFAALAEIPELSKIVGNNRCTVIPRGDGPNGRHMSLNIYWVMTIPSGCAQKALAYQFLKTTACAAMDKVTSLEGGNGTRLSTWRDPDVQRQFRYYQMIERVHQNVESPPTIPEYPAINEVLNRAIDDALHGRKAVKQALDEAAEESEEILSKAGYYKQA